MVPQSSLFAARVVLVDDDVVVDRIRRPEGVHPLRGEELLVDDPLQQRLRVVEQVAGGVAVGGMLEDRRVAPLQLPRGEEERPVDVIGELGEVDSLEIAPADEPRRRDLVIVPVVLEPVRTRLLEREQRLLLASRVLLPRGLLLCVRAVELRLPVAEQARRDVHGARGVEHVDNGMAVLVRDLHRRMLRTRRRTADEQRNPEAAALHLARDEHHLVQRRRDETREADDVHLLRDGLVQNLRRRRHHAEVDHLVVVALQHDTDDVLASSRY
jgi:hypothetical protein